MPRSKGIVSASAGPPCAYCTNSTPQEEAVICSICGETSHRYCAGVPMKDFRTISENNPHTCAQCQRKADLKTISVMQDTIVALKTEISELRAALSEASNKREQRANWSDVVSRGRNPARVDRSQPRGVSGAAREPEHSGPRRRVTNQLQQGSSPSQQSKSRVSPETERHHSRRACTQIEGARKVWGTHKITTIGEVKGAISMLANIAAEELTVKRKFKAPVNYDRSTSVRTRGANKWWFVLRAEESILKRLEELWDTLALPRRWRLEPLLRFTENDSSLESHGLSPSQSLSQESSPGSGGNGAATTTAQQTHSESLNPGATQSPTPNSKSTTSANSEVSANPNGSGVVARSQTFLETD